jgi:hypothetical protein
MNKFSKNLISISIFLLIYISLNVIISTPVQAQTSINSYKQKRSFSEIWHDLNNKKEYNKHHNKNYLISGQHIVQDFGGFLKNFFTSSTNSKARNDLDNHTIMINNALMQTDDANIREYLYQQYEENFQAKVNLDKAEVEQRRQQLLQQKQQNLNNNSDINSGSWGNEMQTQDIVK